MKCPHYVEEETTETAAWCVAAAVPFEPSRIDRIDHCTTDRHRRCPLYRNASHDVSLAIRREVSRAIG